MIETNFLKEVAHFIDTKVDKVVINGTYVISDFQVKKVNQNVMTLNYMVPVAEVSLITLIELKDSSDQVISTNQVNIPITTDHLMIQTMEVKGGA
ncbi:hypothetical protein [Caldalkalibacillus mannanilyticus]|uniref:hypothetical protein n=1 Tax=Caldalkalibacillus mannanilyticus TaxID=1418 RepID=UPI00046A1AE9|nr:hypothetical protein [Caldalkalibacillus mannanilyticus]